MLTHEAMNVAGKTWQRSRQTLWAPGSYIQPCDDLLILLEDQEYKRCFILSLFKLKSVLKSCMANLVALHD